MLTKMVLMVACLWRVQFDKLADNVSWSFAANWNVELTRRPAQSVNEHVERVSGHQLISSRAGDAVVIGNITVAIPTAAAAAPSHGPASTFASSTLSVDVAFATATVAAAAVTGVAVADVIVTSVADCTCSYCQCRFL